MTKESLEPRTTPAYLCARHDSGTSSFDPSWQEAAVILSNVLLQIIQVLCVLLLAPLLQGFILKAEERVQRSRGPSILQPYRDLWKFFHKQSVVPESASWIYLIAPIIAFTAMMIVPILIPVITDRPLPLSDMGDMLGGGMILTLGSFAIILAGLDSGNVYGGIGSSRAVMLAILAEPTLDSGAGWNQFAGQGDVAVCRQSSPAGKRLRILEPGASVPDPGLFYPASGRDGSPPDPFEHAS